LASGADIMCAEALLDAGAEIHVVLPFATDEFVRSSVADGGPEWVGRFQRCMDAATSINYATDDAYLGDDVLYRYGAELAMGLALLRARFLDAPVRQLAVWDGSPAGGEAGTAIDITTWTGHGHPVTVIAPTEPPLPAASVPISHRDDTGRVVRAILFADVKGFSKLTDEQLPSFAEHVLGAMAEVLDRHADAVSYRNTWGDAVYAVLTDVVSAAACALEMQEAMGAIDLDACGLPGRLALRLGAHVGPVFSIVDPVLGKPSYMGSHVSRTARIEPVTPPGAVFATEAFAAALELEHSRFGFDYVGHIPAAKDFGRLRMYRLHPARTPRTTDG
ncbi:MAG: adenylate/guanylate cyclase domain-containing protein, partial [Actinomycetota bacterium]|nr:adenylate/guanylate cyclase domain-containing protein [Actinomycetota bacterium]